MAGDRSNEARVARAWSRPAAFTRFARSLKPAGATGDRTAIEDVLDAAESDDRTALLDELLILEVELRRDGGEAPSPRRISSSLPGRGRPDRGRLRRDGGPCTPLRREQLGRRNRRSTVHGAHGGRSAAGRHAERLVPRAGRDRSVWIGDYESSKRSPAAAWGLSTRPGTRS